MAIPGMTAMALGFAVLGRADTRHALTLAAIAIGVGNGMTAGLVQVLAQDLAPPPPDTAPFIGLWSTLSYLGTLAGPLVAGSAAQLAGVSRAAQLISVLGVSGAGWMMCFVPETLARRKK